VTAAPDGEKSERAWFRRTSMGRRVLLFVLIGEVVFGVTLGVTVGLFAARSAAQARRESLQQISAIAAASLMPMVADQQVGGTEAQIGSIMALAGPTGINSIRVTDSSGQVIAQSQNASSSITMPVAGGYFGTLVGVQVVEEPVVVDGLEVGQVRIQFNAPDLRDTLGMPVLASLIVVLSIALVSVPWTAWLLVRNLLEPIEELRDGAIAVAQGRRDIRLYHGRKDELGRVAEAFDLMSRQLGDQDQRLRESNESLQRALAVEESGRAELERISKMKSDFVAVASHELRAPIAVVRLYASMLDHGELGRLTKAAREAVGSIHAAANRLNSIISDLMDAALLDRGLMPLSFEDLRLDDVAQEAVTDGRAMAVALGVRVEIEEPAGEVCVCADAVRIRQILDNLISNAVKYSAGAHLVTVKVFALDGQGIVEVSDRGRGIPPGSRGELFGLFGRLDAEDNRLIAGLGLGLAISARAAAAQGGVVSHRDNPGGGSVFSLTLPLRDPGEGPFAPATFSVSDEGS
jgi:signal transduction histidine kinase